MKKDTLQKVLASALVGAMAMGTLTGCGSEPADSSNSSSSTQSSSSSSSTSSSSTTEGSSSSSSSSAEASSSSTSTGATGIDSFTAFDSKVTLKIPVYDRGDSSNGVSDVVNNYWTQWVQTNFGDKYNIDVEYVAITRSAVMTDYTLLAAGKDLPTICMEYDYDKLATWQSEGYLQPYDMEQLKTIAPTYYQNMVDNGIDVYTQLNGEDYLCLGMRPYGNTNYTFITWYRQDWVEKVGMTGYPKTSAERLELFQKLVDEGIAEHPAGGAKVSGAGADQNYGWRDQPQDELTWATTGDYQIPALSTEAQKRFLKFENELFNRGFKNPEYYTRDLSEQDSDFINGKTFEWSGYTSSNMEVLKSFYEANPDAKLGVKINSGKLEVDPEWKSTNSFRPTNVFGAMTAFSNTATEDQIKAAMMYMEWMAQEENLFTMTWGIEGKNYNMVDGQPVAVADQKGLEEQQGHNNNVDYWMIVTAAKTLGNIEDDIKAIAPQGLPQDFYEDILANYKGENAMYNNGAYSDCNFATSFDSVTEYGTTLKEELYPEYRDQLTMCKPEEFDALYEELSQKYLDAGYQAVIDERKEAYEAGLSTKLPK
ncbi:MAG: extracellular solute-binding protein [Lachnospiraceae bacterium]|nr:extracellular solute-binding protein [Lachnospiraceae bacterium]